VSNQDTMVVETGKVTQTTDGQNVADYLRRNPNFFEDKPTLLSDLRVPHATGSAVSLVERQVTVLRDTNTSLREQLDALVQVARDNDNLNTLLHNLTLRLIDGDSLVDLLALIETRLQRDFSADLVAVRLLLRPENTALGSIPECAFDADSFSGLFQRLLSVGKPYCGTLKAEQLEALFGDQASEVGSSAVLPLSRRNGGGQGELGLIAIGSFDRERFHTGVNTTFLSRMSELLATNLQRHLQIND